MSDILKELNELVGKEMADRQAAGWSKEKPVEKPIVVKPVKIKLTPEALKTLIINLYLINGRDSTVFELAAHAGVSESTIRKVLTACHGVPDGCYMDEEVRESHSKNYRGMVSGSHKVWVYGPSRSTLRTMYIEAQGHITALQSRFGVPTSESEAVINAVGAVAKEG